MLRIVLLVLALPFFLLGAEGLYNATRARQQATLTCEQYARGDRPSLLVRLTGCEIDYSGAAYRESGGRIRELFFPARPAGRGGPASLVAVTNSPAALQLAQSALGNRRQRSAEELSAAMQSAAAAAGASGEISGLIRSGVLRRFSSSRVLSGIGVPLADNVSILDLEAQPGFLFPVLQIAVGLILFGAGFLMGRESPPLVAEPDSAERAEVLARLQKHIEDLRLADEGGASSVSGPPQPTSRPEGRAVGEQRRAVEQPAPGRAMPERLPAIMLLNVDPSASAADIESAPPLGPRPEVIVRLRKVLPDLVVDASGRWRRAGRDYSLQLDLGSGDIVHTVVLESAGKAGAAAVRSLIESTGWRAFVPKSGRFLDAESLDPVSDNIVALR
jgi:hypothetical protein